MNGNPTAAQKRFHEWCRGFGCLICRSQPAIHHIKGSKMKLKGCVKPGELYILPLCWGHHQGEHSIHSSKKNFEESYGTQKELWISLIGSYIAEYGNFPTSEEEYQIIRDRA
jgi:hypothetical protein